MAIGVRALQLNTTTIVDTSMHVLGSSLFNSMQHTGPESSFTMICLAMRNNATVDNTIFHASTFAKQLVKRSAHCCFMLTPLAPALQSFWVTSHNQARLTLGVLVLWHIEAAGAFNPLLAVASLSSHMVNFMFALRSLIPRWLEYPPASVQECFPTPLGVLFFFWSSYAMLLVSLTMFLTPRQGVHNGMTAPRKSNTDKPSQHAMHIP